LKVDEGFFDNSGDARYECSVAQYDLITLTPEDEAVDDERNIRDLDDRPILRAARKANVVILVTRI